MKKLTSKLPLLGNNWYLPKFLMVMKLTAFIFIATTLNLFAVGSYSQATRLNVSFENSSVLQVLSYIEEQSDFYFLYSTKLVDVSRTLSVDYKDALIDDVLAGVFEGTDVDYLVMDKQVVLSKKELLGKVPRVDIQQQGRTITGDVTDESGQPVIGVSIVVKGTTNGTITNVDGSYTLDNVPDDAVLVFSYVGMLAQEVPVGAQTTIDVTMVYDAIGIEEVIAIGYGTLKKKDLTGSVSSIGGDEIVSRGDTNPLQALQGAVPGAQITNPTGRVGDSPEILIRGKGSFDYNVPLYVVDGAVVDNIDFLNPNNIARIDILKDASSSAIYGSRGSNGVVLIETNGASYVREGTTDFSFNTFYGIKSKARFPDFMNAKEWVQYRLTSHSEEARFDDVPSEFDPFFSRIFIEEPFAPNGRTSYLATEAWYGDYEGYDWENEVLQTGMQSNTYLNVSHNHSGSSYVMGMGYQKETGIVENESLEKYNLNASINQKLSDKLSAGFSINASFSDLEQGSEIAVENAFTLSPITEPWIIDDNMQPIVGEIAFQPGAQRGKTFMTGTVNPLMMIKNTRDNFRKWDLFGNAFLAYKPVDWVTLRSSFSPSLYSYRRGRFWGADTDVNRGTRMPSSRKDYSEYFNYTWDNQMNINKIFNDVHNVNVLLLQSTYLNRYESAQLGSSKQPFETSYHNVGSGPSDTYQLESNFSQSQLLSYAARVNYIYNEKYLFTFTARADGTSKFSEDNRWGWFPSGAIAWRISEESFMKDITPINNLKLRFSLGQSGNNNVSNYATLNRLSTKLQYDFNGEIMDAWVFDALANKALVWEKITEYDLGLDFAFLNYRISGTVDWYNRFSDQLLVNQKLPLETGFSSIPSNAASVRNRGVEIVLNTTNVQTNSVNWRTSLTFAKNNNEVVSVYGQKVDDVGNNRFIGQSLDVVYNFVFDGIWQYGEEDAAAVYGQEPGEARVKDLNNDNAITASDDRTFIGSADPTWEGGLTSTLQVLNFDFSFSIFSRQGVYAYSPSYERYGDLFGRGNNKLDVDYWAPNNRFGVPSNPSNTYPYPRQEGPFWRGRSGVGFYKDLSYVKVRNISLGYYLPQELLSKINVKSLRIYANVLNPFVFTDFEGFDPEWGEAERGVARVSTITYQFGLNLNF